MTSLANLIQSHKNDLPIPYSCSPQRLVFLSYSHHHHEQQMHCFLVPSDDRSRLFEQKLVFEPPITRSLCNEPFKILSTNMSKRVSINPHVNDVLMGRGGKNNQHSGNEHLRQIARVESERYRLSTKKGKSAISRQLVKQMRDLNPPARFLKKEADSGEWVEVGEDTAREKASQVLRDAVTAYMEKVDRESAYMPPHPPREVYTDDSQIPSARRSSAPAEPTPSVGQPPSSFPSASFPSAKRRRYSSGSTSRYTTRGPGYHVYESYQSHVVYSPVRRHADYRYHPYYAYGGATPCSGRNRRSHHDAQHPIPSHQASGRVAPDINEFDLFNGELLESDGEEGPPEPVASSSSDSLWTQKRQSP